MRPFYRMNGTRTPDGHDAQVPRLPREVMSAAVTRGIALPRLRYDALMGCWFVPNWKGMFLGIEKDGYAHT